MSEFILDKKLENDSFFVSNLKLSQLRLVDNSNYPWIILIPRINNIIEITDLNDASYNQLGQEIKFTATIIQKLFTPHKLNISSIGNIVKQLHIHLVARYESDKLFPKPVWGDDFVHYDRVDAELKIKELSYIISNNIFQINI
jgi:diadenosine tetraphosphate (Ap4A) HIT family hydrolase